MIFYGMAPMTAAALAMAAVAVLTAAHILHRRYARVQVPALRFWSAALKKHRQDTLGGRLRHPLTWLLLCGLIGLLILAMLEPALSGDRGPRPWVVLLDRRATMSLPCDTAPTRLDRARSLAWGFLDRVAGPVGVTLVAVDRTATVLSREGDPRTEALYHLGRLSCTQATDGQGLDQALNLAETLVRRQPRTGVLLLTDHPLTDLDLPAILRSRMTVVNVAESVDNLAVLPPQITPLADGRVRFEVWLAHWGDAPCRATLTLLKDGQRHSEQTVSLGPDQMQAVEFQVGSDEISTLSARVAREAAAPEREVYTLDDQAEPIAWHRRRVFLPDDAPTALKAAIAANPAYQRVAVAADADACISLATGEATAAETYGPIQVTEALCPDPDQRRAWMTDLFVGPHPCPIPSAGSSVVLLETANSQPLAVRTGTSPSVVTLSASLFDERATFWKRPQFLAILEAALGPAGHTNDGWDSPRGARACYSNLTLSASDLQEARSLPVVRPPVPLARGILWVALIVAVFELVCYALGKIV